MHTTRMGLAMTLAASLLAVGCATGRFPAELGPGMDANAAIGQAEQQIEAAVRSGADSLAVTAMQAARANLSAARASREKSERIAVLRAQEAAADAAYARAVAEREMAERARVAAQTALDQVGTGRSP